MNFVFEFGVIYEILKMYLKYIKTIFNYIFEKCR